MSFDDALRQANRGEKTQRSICAHVSNTFATAAKLAAMDWNANLIATPAEIRELILQTKCIAVLGMKTEAQADQPAFYVPAYLARAGFEVIPVPVYYPEVTKILGKPVYRRVNDIPDEIDLVDVFRRSHDI